jgi:single-stranded-DNA-specific exonuclease
MFPNLSITGKKWKLKESDERTATAIAQRYELPQIIAHIIASRGYNLDSAPSFINPKLRELLPDPLILKDMEKAIARAWKAIEAKETITVYGDYDVDGATASALIRRYFRSIYVPCEVYIPDRLDEGYGANSEALETLKSKGTDLVIMVDCGTNAFKPLEDAAAAGLDIIVLDHHTAEPRLPPAAAIVNPNRLDQDLGTYTDLRYVCAAGMAFLFVVALNRLLREKGFFTPERPEPDVRQFLDLVALGTICDVMPLKGLNRAFAKLGFEITHKNHNRGLKALRDVAGITAPPTSYHFGFIMGPRVNAGGRVGLSTLGSDLLTTEDPIQAQIIAKELDELNRQRQEIEKYVLEQALEQIEKHDLHKRGLIMVHGEDWHPGVIGIVASRIKDKYHRPACVVSFENGLGKGSGRSIPGIEMGAAMHQALHKGLLEKGGGHAMAAGFTVHAGQYGAFYDFLDTAFTPLVESAVPHITLDGALALGGANIELAKALEVLEPFGQGNPTPHFALSHVRPAYTQPVGENHLRVELADESGKRLKAMAFRAVGTPLGDALTKPTGHLYHVAGTLKLDTWNGKEQLTFIIEDMMPAAT